MILIRGRLHELKEEAKTNKKLYGGVRSCRVWFRGSVEVWCGVWRCGVWSVEVWGVWDVDARGV
jgi:hypothetical protein